MLQPPRSGQKSAPMVADNEQSARPRQGRELLHRVTGEHASAHDGTGARALGIGGRGLNRDGNVDARIGAEVPAAETMRTVDDLDEEE